MSAKRRVKFDIETAHCGLCAEREAKICDSTAYCKTCQKFLCLDCLKPHRKLVAMDNHVLLNRDHVINDKLVVHFDQDQEEDSTISKVPEEIESTFKEYEIYRKRTLEEIEKNRTDVEDKPVGDTEPGIPEYEFYEHCGEHPDEKVKFFCTLHQQLCCEVCVAELHSTCCSSVKFIPEYMHHIEKKEDTIGKFKQLISDLKDFDKCLQGDMKELKKSRHTFLYDLRAKKTELLNWMNLMEVRAVRRLEIVFDKCKREIDRKRQTTKKACQKLRAEMYFLKEIIGSKQHDDVYKYVKERKAEQRLKEVGAKRENRQFTKSRFYLNVNSDFESARTSINYLYELNFVSKGEDKYNVRLKDDKHVSDITGCTFMENGDMILADRNNCKLKHIDSNFKCNLHIVVPDDVFDVTSISHNAVAFTSPIKSKIHVAEVRPSLKIVKTISPGEGSCWGLSHHDGVFAVSVTVNEQFSIRVVDFESNILFQTDTKRQLYPAMIKEPESKVLHVIAAHAYEDGNDLTLERYIDAYRSTDDTHITVSVYNFLNHLHIRGVALDRHSNVSVCCWDTDQVYTIAMSGDEAELLLAESDGLCRPLALCYSADASKLLVTSELTDFIQMFRIEAGRNFVGD